MATGAPLASVGQSSIIAQSTGREVPSYGQAVPDEHGLAMPEIVRPVRVNWPHNLHPTHLMAAIVTVG